MNLWSREEKKNGRRWRSQQIIILALPRTSSMKDSVWFLLISAYMTECQFLAEKTLPGEEVSSWLNT